VVIVTTDLIGLPRTITDFVAARVQKEYGLERSRLLFNSSDTHSGPVLRLGFATFSWTPEDRHILEEYRRDQTEKLFSAVGAALGDLTPAQLSYSSGEARFAVNRRAPSTGSIDPDVPVLRVISMDGRLKAVVFGYACQNATLPAGFYEISGDYAGSAQNELEKSNPGATAMFLMLCGGDQIPSPSGSLDLAQQHGHALATEVNRVLSANPKPLHGPLNTAFQNIDLNFALNSRATYEEELKSPDRARVLRAQAMLEAYNGRQSLRQMQYPIQAVRFGKGLTILALGGEVAADYAWRAKSQYPGELMVAGYSNDVMSYIPSRRMLDEGGYEPVESMISYGLPGPYANDIEERITAGIRQVIHRVGIERK
jgi:hypothetical protein